MSFLGQACSCPGTKYYQIKGKEEIFIYGARDLKFPVSFFVFFFTDYSIIK
jgi:hypothetical protein